jgi:hypothetical protein
MNKKIFLISYWVNKEGNSPAIMADDKIISLLKLNYKILILSSFASKKIRKKNVLHYRIPSLSFFDFQYEFRDSIQNKEIYKLIFFVPLVLSVGLIFDIIQLILLKGTGGGKWFWTISALPLSIFIKLSNSCKILITTGGPASSHLVGLILSKLFNLKFLVYLQDPLVGSGIGRNESSKNFLMIFERLIIKQCTKVIFVTKTAAKEAINRFAGYSYNKKIFGIYSGAVKYNIKNIIKIKTNKKKLLLHAGTLYNSRNLDSLVKAINYLNYTKKFDFKSIEILNLGDIYGPMKKEYSELPYFRSQKITSRALAITKFFTADILLLIQHTDNRSASTIPFKTYDYLNSKKVIFALINNDELKNFLSKRGHICADVSNYKDVANKLISLLKDFKKIEQNVKKCKLEISHLNQTKKIFKNIKS